MGVTTQDREHVLRRSTPAIAAAVVAAVVWFPAAPRVDQGEQPRAAAGSKTWELRLYTAAAGRLPDLVALERSRAAERTRYAVQPVFSATVLEGAASDGDRALRMLVDIVAHDSRAAADRGWAALDADAGWRAAWTAAEKNGPLLDGAPVSIFMAATDFSPAFPPLPASGSPRLFELRKYNTGPDGLDDTVVRFRRGLAKVLVDSGMAPLAYWTTEDKTAFVYLVAHRDREAARVSWADFMPGYREFMTKFNAERTTPAPAPGRRTPDDNRMLVPTDASPLR
jgi:hypothetical protein